MYLFFIQIEVEVAVSETMENILAVCLDPLMNFTLQLRVPDYEYIRKGLRVKVRYEIDEFLCVSVIIIVVVLCLNLNEEVSGNVFPVNLFRILGGLKDDLNKFYSDSLVEVFVEDLIEDEVDETRLYEEHVHIETLERQQVLYYVYDS